MITYLDSAAGCFTGDTKIKCIDGEFSFLELVERFRSGKQIFVFSKNEESRITIAKVSNVFKTKTVDKILKLVLSNREIVECTLDHRFMLKNGQYKEAQNLTTLDELMPFYDRYKKVKIVSSKIVEKTQDVYDLTVEPFHNFALSAGVFVHNSAKAGRWKEFQAVLPLRGKILNVSKSDMSKILNSEIIKGIAAAIGGGIGKTFNVNNIRYDKIVILTDADVKIPLASSMATC